MDHVDILGKRWHTGRLLDFLCLKKNLLGWSLPTGNENVKGVGGAPGRHCYQNCPAFQLRAWGPRGCALFSGHRTGALSAAGSLTQSEFSIRNKPDGLSQFPGLIKSLFSLPRLKATWRRWLLEGSGLTPSPPVLPWDPGGAPFPCPLPSAPHISRPAA